MLTIRLSRHWRSKLPFFRIVLTEHTQPVKAGFKEVLGRFNPIKHTMEADVTKIKEWISKWSQISSRVAKLLFTHTKDKEFEKFFEKKDIVRKPKKESKE